MSQSIQPRVRPQHLEASNGGLVTALIVVASLIVVVILLLIGIKLFRECVQKKREEELRAAMSKARQNAQVPGMPIQYQQ